MKRFRPELESLNDRIVPAVSVAISGTSLVITGDGDDNVINVSSSGAAVPGNIRGRIDGQSLNVLTGRQLNLTTISHVSIFAKGGDDVVRITLPLGLGSTQSLYADLGSGDDTYIGNLGGFFDFGSRFNQTVTGYGGDDNITTNFDGTMLGILDSSIDGGKGENTISANVGLFTFSTGVINSYVNARGDDTLFLNLYNDASPALINTQLNANDNDVTVYSAIVGSPNLTTQVFNGENVTEFTTVVP